MQPQPTHAARSDGAPPVPVHPHSTNRLSERASKLIAPTVALLAALAVWWGIVRVFEIPDYLLPAPQAVAARIVKEWPLLVKHGVYTLLSVLTGFASAVAIGVPLAFGIVLNRSMERVAMPFLVMSQTIKSVETDMIDLVRSMGARTLKIMLRGAGRRRCRRCSPASRSRCVLQWSAPSLASSSAPTAASGTCC